MDYAKDISKYVGTVQQPAVAAIVNYCGIALTKADAATVSGSDPMELARVRDGFAAKRLQHDAATADTAIQSVLTRMRAERRTSRVTFYYLLAEATGTLDRLTGGRAPAAPAPARA